MGSVKCGNNVSILSSVDTDNGDDRSPKSAPERSIVCDEAFHTSSHYHFNVFSVCCQVYFVCFGKFSHPETTKCCVFGFGAENGAVILRRRLVSTE